MSSTIEVHGKACKVQMEANDPIELLSASFIPAKEYGEAELVFEFRMGSAAKDEYGETPSWIEANVSLRSANGAILMHDELNARCRPGGRCIAKLTDEQLPDFDVVDIIGRVG